MHLRIRRGDRRQSTGLQDQLPGQGDDRHQRHRCHPPETRITCPECGHTEAYYVIRQTRAADESPTRFYRCCKCNHTWREYS
ncbi:RPA12/RPB9/RPC11 RNA polymerase family protein [Candidatus Methanomethylophilus sp. 1R26]|uniref:RPA12/RPB9/RPC11 RNA polymerase family protein n=1 Tax=Candidatus Methanomethylophilus sp. 1R26 TaxID=1769296 RepID=UPI00373FD011